MHTFTAHQSRIRSISIDTENKALITGSIDGELKVKESIYFHNQYYIFNFFFFLTIDLGRKYL